MKKWCAVLFLVIAFIVPAVADSGVAFSMTNNAEFWYYDSFQSPSWGGVSLEGSARMDVPFCELRPGAEIGVWGWGLYLMGECGFAFPLAYAGDWYTLKFIATPSAGVGTIESFYPMYGFEASLESRFSFNEHLSLLLATGVKSHRFTTSNFIPVTIGFEYAERTKR